MTTLTEARHEVADLLRGVVGDVPVYTAPPSNIAAPAVMVAVRDAVQTGRCLWSQTVRVSVIGPGGDNEAGLAELERLLMLCATTLSAAYHQAVAWDAPGTFAFGGSSYLTANLDVVLDVSA